MHPLQELKLIMDSVGPQTVGKRLQLLLQSLVQKKTTKKPKQNQTKLLKTTQNHPQTI